MVADEGEPVEERQVQERRFTSIRVRKETVQMLKERGRKGESYDDIIKKLLQRRRR